MKKNVFKWEFVSAEKLNKKTVAENKRIIKFEMSSFQNNMMNKDIPENVFFILGFYIFQIFLWCLNNLPVICELF